MKYSELNNELQNMDITFDSNEDEVGKSLMKTLAEIKRCGKTPELKAEMLFKYARMKFFSRDFKDSHEIFGQLSSHTIDSGLPEIIELYYWVARIFEEQGKLDRSLSAYKLAIERLTGTLDEKFNNELLDRILNIERK